LPPSPRPTCAARTWSRAALRACSSTPCWRARATASSRRSRWPRSSRPTISRRWWPGSAPTPRLPPADGRPRVAASPKEPAMTSPSPLPIDVISDVVCPWCYIGKRRLEQAIALKPEIPVEVRFQPYFLNDWVPRDGISREQYLITKFGSVERYNANNQRVVDAAAAAGLPYAREKILRQPNTLDCHRLIFWASQIGTAAAMKQRLMAFYFGEGGDLTDREILVRAGGECGLDPDDVRKRLSSDEDV